MKSQRSININRTERGQSLVELAISLMILLIILAGVVDLGNMMFQYMAMRDAAQEAAAYGSIFPRDCEDIEDRAMASLFNAEAYDPVTNPDGILVTIIITNTTADPDIQKYCVDAAAYEDPVNKTEQDACAPNGITVTIEQPNFPITMPLLGTFLGRQSVHLEAAMTDTILRPACP
ncbi:MAG TPA: TadE/TadG family type IV pilus assembly protein [Anaerolineaceae bacterium]|nr:TadE/TadG family type IV pilus assembly protein [Anaerolineaceae bacterium]